MQQHLARAAQTAGGRGGASSLQAAAGLYQVIITPPLSLFLWRLSLPLSLSVPYSSLPRCLMLFILRFLI